MAFDAAVAVVAAESPLPKLVVVVQYAHRVLAHVINHEADHDLSKPESRPRRGEPKQGGGQKTARSERKKGRKAAFTTSCTCEVRELLLTRLVSSACAKFLSRSACLILELLSVPSVMRGPE